jgi:hypothetical protein
MCEDYELPMQDVLAWMVTSFDPSIKVSSHPSLSQLQAPCLSVPPAVLRIQHHPVKRPEIPIMEPAVRLSFERLSVAGRKVTRPPRRREGAHMARAAVYAVQRSVPTSRARANMPGTDAGSVRVRGVAAARVLVRLPEASMAVAEGTGSASRLGAAIAVSAFDRAGVSRLVSWASFRHRDGFEREGCPHQQCPPQ